MVRLLKNVCFGYLPLEIIELFAGFFLLERDFFNTLLVRVLKWSKNCCSDIPGSTDVTIIAPRPLSRLVSDGFYHLV